MIVNNIVDNKKRGFQAHYFVVPNMTAGLGFSI